MYCRPEMAQTVNQESSVYNYFSLHGANIFSLFTCTQLSEHAVQDWFEFYLVKFLDSQFPVHLSEFGCMRIKSLTFTIDTKIASGWEIRHINREHSFVEWDINLIRSTNMEQNEEIYTMRCDWNLFTHWNQLRIQNFSKGQSILVNIWQMFRPHE